MRALFAAALLFGVTPAFAQQVVRSAASDAVSVTVYTNGQGDEVDLDWPEGYALITETRTVDLPAGPSELRFESVAGGIIPVSAIVSGLPGGVVEKNRDARLLSPGGLINASLGKRVHLRRTNRATGAVTETSAILRSGPDGVVVQTREGIEALRCSGLPETLSYDHLPDGLVDKPTLAVNTVSPAAARATLRLSYLATGFDWRANYVVNMDPAGRTLSLFAWLTLANGNDESFVAAQTQAVAGAINREEVDALGESGVQPYITLRCWPRGTTSDVALQAPPPPAAMESYDIGDGEEIVVTGSRIRRETLATAAPVVVMTAEQEELGDLKLYRIPEPVTVAAHAQKQVALLAKPAVRFERLYGADLRARGEQDVEPAAILLRLKNDAKRGLGLPLPAGNVAVFEQVGDRPMLAGEQRMDDTAVGQEFDLRIGESPQVQVVQRRVARARENQDDERRPELYEVEISNANNAPAVVETLLRTFEDDWRLEKPSRKLILREGRRAWRATVPANGRAVLRYTMKPIGVKVGEVDD